MAKCNVAIIGAGPYGLSLAAQLKALGVDFRIFGNPMHTWMTQMPKGMRLKSEGFASSLYDLKGEFTLRQYCKERDIPYADSGLPVPIEVFIAYGMEFQKRYVPELENKLVQSVTRTASGDFELKLDDGEVFRAKRVVVAAGISHYAYIPPMLAALPGELVSHSSQHSRLEGFRGREVAVVGAGASALDLAALLHEAGAKVQLIARKPKIRFHDPPSKKPRTWFERLRQPATGIGPGWKLYLCAYTPWAFRYLPKAKRLELVKKILGPAPGWFIKEQVVGKMPFHLEREIVQARPQNGRVSLDLAAPDGTRETVYADHVIAATGYRVDLRRLAFLNSDMLGQIQQVEKAPVLSANFESSMPGLFFIGTSAANTFGPLMRFAYGARFAAPRLSSHLATLPYRKSADSLTHDSVPKLKVVDRDEVGVH